MEPCSSWVGTGCPWEQARAGPPAPGGTTGGSPPYPSLGCFHTCCQDAPCSRSESGASRPGGGFAQAGSLCPRCGLLRAPAGLAVSRPGLRAAPGRVRAGSEASFLGLSCAVLRRAGSPSRAGRGGSRGRGRGGSTRGRSAAARRVRAAPASLLRAADLARVLPPGRVCSAPAEPSGGRRARGGDEGVLRIFEFF